MAEAVISSDDEFDAAFGQAVAAAVSGAPLVDAPAVDMEKSDAVPAKDDKAAEAGSAKAEGEPAGEGEKPAADGGAGAEAPVGEASGGGTGGGAEKPAAESEPSGAGAKPGVTAEDFAKLSEKLDKLQPKEPPPEPPKTPDAPEPFKFSDEEQRALESYEKEWDEHARVMSIREKKLAHDLEQRFVAALDVVLQSINEGLAPVLQNHLSLAKDQHIAKLTQAHSDWEQHKEGVSKWIDSKPAYLRTAMRQAYDNGDTEATIDLLSQYKKEAGKTAPAASSAPKAPLKDTPSAEALAATAPVRERRTSVATSGVDMNDYDAAWKEAAG